MEKPDVILLSLALLSIFGNPQTRTTRFERHRNCLVDSNGWSLEMKRTLVTIAFATSITLLLPSSSIRGRIVCGG